MKTVFVAMYLLFTGTLFGQSFTYPEFRKSYKTVNEIAPTDWTLLNYTKGDLNGDKLNDLVAVLEYKKPVAENRPYYPAVETKPRILLIFFKTANGIYNLKLQHNTFLFRDNEDMRPEVFPDLKIRNGVFSLHYDLFHDYPTYKFRFQKGDFYLIGATISGIHGGNYSENDINLSTGEFHKTSYYIDDEKNVKKESFRLKNLKPIKFTEFKMPLTYKISEDYTL